MAATREVQEEQETVDTQIVQVKATEVPEAVGMVTIITSSSRVDGNSSSSNNEEVGIMISDLRTPTSAERGTTLTQPLLMTTVPSPLLHRKTMLPRPHQQNSRNQQRPSNHPNKRLSTSTGENTSIGNPVSAPTTIAHRQRRKVDKTFPRSTANKNPTLVHTIPPWV